VSDRLLTLEETVLATGGTGGMGLVAAAGLAGLGARVRTVGRSAARGVAAADAIRRAAPPAEVDEFMRPSVRGTIRSAQPFARTPTAPRS
jgi:NAD(P)-dependent dehydrogenase (short-subunit alcohol dehydrogenase family)